MQVRHLFSPQHAARAVQAFKSRNWSQIEFLSLLESIARHGSPHRLSPLAARALYGFMPTVSNPLVRHACIELLNSVKSVSTADTTSYDLNASYDNDPNVDGECTAALAKSYLNSEDTEIAYTLIASAGASTASSSGANNSSMIGASMELANRGACRLKPRTRAMWSKLFENCVSADDYSRARSLWLAKPADTGSGVVVIGEPVLQSFIGLIGRHRDRDLLRDVLLGTKHELPLESGTIAASLLCFAAENNVDSLISVISQHASLIEEHVALQDLSFISDLLAPHVLQLYKHGSPTFGAGAASSDMVKSRVLGNLVLQGLYRQNTSQTVLHFYRYLARANSFESNAATAQVVANAAYRLGNSKLLAYEIWREFCSPSSAAGLGRKFYETLLMCQLVGTGYNSVRFFLAEMARRGIPLRSHMQRLLFNKFERLENTAPLVEIASSDFARRYTEFNTEEAALESPNAEQARANASVFINGKSPSEEPLAVLAQMLAFDAHKLQRHKQREQQSKDATQTRF